ncbi:hypothetical protein CEP53_006600 [Fusarium sp. AF-6]|nr:hypothetical protein CEP53_006600 [Fusarium sp. AF-6]
MSAAEAVSYWFNTPECLRDIDLEDEALRLAIRGEPFLSMRFAPSFIGEKYGRVRAFEEHPTGKRKETTPCEYVDLTERHLEPLLIRFASHHNFKVRFSTEIVGVESITDDAGSPQYICTLHDDITKQTFEVRTKYLFGADGARSWTARHFDIKFLSKGGGPKACNVLLRADLGTHLSKERYSGLHWIVQPDRIIFPAFGPGGTNPFEGLTADSQELVDLVRHLVGDESIDVDILQLDPWTVRETVAESYSSPDRGVFIHGDAAHRHPPTFGLGSNTCIQDAYNLAWKVAYVSKGLAGPSLLDSYSKERQPVGSNLVRESNNQIQKNTNIWDVLGMTASSTDERMEQLAELSQATPEGSARRARLHDALEGKTQEFESLGLAYNQWYTSAAVYLEDEPSPRPLLEGDPIVEVQISTLSRESITPHDLDYRPRWEGVLLFVGVEGNGWRAAAEKVKSLTGIPINVYEVGPGQEWVDIYRDWHKKRGVDEDGCVLVRPDRFVAWWSFSKVQDYEQKLAHILGTVLSRDEL